MSKDFAPTRPATANAGDSDSAAVDFLIPAPDSPSGAALSTRLALLLENAARHAEIAAQFARANDRANARGHLRAAAEALNEAEIED